MRRTLFALLSLLFFIPILSVGQKNTQTEEEKEIMAARQVMMRLLGMKSDVFTFEKIPSSKGLDEFEVIALSGKVLVKGTSTIAMTRGAYEYLRTACNIQYTWSTEKIVPPASFPDFTIPRTVSPYKYRQYYNVCAYGYTNPFWKWEDWQRELDWMALHGINMPVAMAGQEAIWQKVYKEMGMTDQELKSYFTGPAFLPWQRMGNVNKHDGPLPQSYIDESQELQKLLIDRMMQLGMQPIVPGFSGFVPEAYKRLYPDTKLLSVKGWCDFPDTNQAYILSPGSPDFIKIGKKFIQEYQNTYGKVHFYLADLFNENEVPVSSTNRHAELADFGQSVYDAINAGDPQGTWVMQGWLFYNNQKFWDKESVRSFLSKVPNDRMIIIDLANESFHGWEKLDGFFGKPWIYSTIHNYGGNSQMVGNLPLYATDAPAMLANPKRGNITGFGISPEGVLNNEVVYELLTDVAWTSKPIDIKFWLMSYAKQRYGTEDVELFHAWLSLLESAYSIPTAWPRNIYQDRPSMSPWSNLDDRPSFDQAVANFLNAADPYMGNPRFKHDLVQMVVQYAGFKVDLLISKALKLHNQGKENESQATFEKVKELMTMMDGLTYTLPDQRLESWIDHARKWGQTKAESDYYEADAKRQITMWGNSGTSVLFEYASKVWSGMIRDYYLPRWMNFAGALKDGSTSNFDQWEESWITTPGLRTKAPIVSDVLSYARNLYNTAGKYALENTEVLSIGAKYKGNNHAEISLSTLFPDPGSIFTPVSTTPVEKTKSKVVKKEDSKLKENPTAQPLVTIYYTTDGSNPTIGSPVYNKPDDVSLPAEFKAAAFYDNKPFGGVVTMSLPVSFGKPVALNPMPSPKYLANASMSVNDMKYGNSDMNAGNWLGFEGANLDAVMNLEGSFKVKKVTVSYLENGNNCIFGPSAVIILTSADGITFTKAYSYDLPSTWNPVSTIKKFTAAFPEKEANFIKITVFNKGICPEGSACTGKKAWLFVDELVVE
jgi:alpha-N-acetylglucosaminidase